MAKARAAAKAAMQRELAKRLRRSELEREIAVQAKKRAQLEQKWREMMMIIKDPIYKKDIKIMWHVFERHNDKKEYQIQYMLKLLDEADEQYQRANSSFCGTVDSMINKFLADLDTMSDDNKRRTAALLKWGEDDMDKINSDHNAAETHLQLLLYVNRTNTNNSMWDARGENFIKEDEEEAKFFDIREDLISFLESSFNLMWEQYKAYLRSYVVGTAENQKQVRRLRRKENMMADIIANQAKRIANSDGLLRRLRVEYAAYETGTKQQGFRDRRDRHRKACAKLKKRLVGGSALDAKKLNILVTATDDTMEWFQNAFKRGKQILKLASICRKFETRREKVLPYDSNVPADSTEAAKTIVRRAQSDDSIVLNAVTATCGLSRMWQRMSKAELTKRALAREKLILENENRLLMMRIRGTKTDDLLTLPPPKSCICNLDDTMKVPNQPTAVEGSAEMRKYSIQNKSPAKCPCSTNVINVPTEF